MTHNEDVRGKLVGRLDEPQSACELWVGHHLVPCGSAPWDFDFAGNDCVMLKIRHGQEAIEPPGPGLRRIFSQPSSAAKRVSPSL